MHAINEDVVVPIALFALLFGLGALGIIARTTSEIICHWRDVSLKMQMVEAGFSPADIEQVMKAGRTDRVPWKRKGGNGATPADKSLPKYSVS